MSFKFTSIYYSLLLIVGNGLSKPPNIFYLFDIFRYLWELRGSMADTSLACPVLSCIVWSFILLSCAVICCLVNEVMHLRIGSCAFCFVADSDSHFSSDMCSGKRSIHCEMK